MSKHKKRVSLAQRTTEAPPVPVQRPPVQQEAEVEVEEQAAPLETPEVSPETPEISVEAPTAPAAGIESHPLFWFVLGALTVGIIVLVGLLLMIPGAATPAAKAAPVATNPAARPATTTPVSAANLPAQPAQPDIAATMTVDARRRESAPRVSLDEAKKKIDAGAVLLVDVRSAQSYDEQHIKGAINIPEADTEARLSDFPRDKEIILYCA